MKWNHLPDSRPGFCQSPGLIKDNCRCSRERLKIFSAFHRYAMGIRLSDSRKDRNGDGQL